MRFFLILVVGYRVESGEMRILREGEREIINFSGGVVITDTNILINSPAALYYQQEGFMELSGPVSGVQGTRNLKCRSARLYENEKIFKGYGGCEVFGAGEYLRCDSVILHENDVQAFGEVFLKSDKDSIEAGGRELNIKENYLSAEGDAFLKYPGDDSLVLFSQSYIYKDSILTAWFGVKVYSQSFEGEGDSLEYKRNLRFAIFMGHANAKNSTNLIKGDTIFMFLTEDNKMDSSIVISKASILNYENSNEMFLEGDTLYFYTEGTDSLKWFKAFNIEGYYKEGVQDGSPQN